MPDPAAVKMLVDPIHLRNLKPRRAVAALQHSGTISGLLFSRSPAAVAWLIALSVVDAIKRQVVAITTLGSPLQKYVEALPVFANGNPLAAITFEACVAVPLTARDHPAPNPMQPRTVHWMSLGSIDAAAAGFRPTRNKRVLTRRSYGAAFASCCRSILSVRSSRMLLKHRPFSKLKTYQVLARSFLENHDPVCRIASQWSMKELSA